MKKLLSFSLFTNLSWKYKNNVFYHQTLKATTTFSKKCYSSCVTRVGGFTNLEEEKLSRNLVVPEKFNFASDVIDKWACKEREGLRSTSVPAFWYVSDDGDELKYNFQEIELVTKKIASVLQQCCGVKKGESAIVMLPKIPEFWFVNIAAIRIGVVFCPVNMMMTVKDLAYRFHALKPSSIIAHESVADNIDEASKSIPELKNKIIVSSKPSRRPGWHDLKQLQPETINHTTASTRSDEPSMIYFTSGTTGHPKMVEHTHASFSLSIQDYGKYCLDLTSKNMNWSMADTGWAFTAYNFLGTWSQGSCLFIHQMTRYSPQETLKVLANYPVDTLVGTPLIYKSLLNEGLEASKLKSLQHCISGGDMLGAGLGKQWFEKTGLRIHNGYGQTETTGLISQRKILEHREGSIGKPLPGVSIAIVDEKENVVGPNTVGEMVVDRKNTLGLFKGYKSNPEANAVAFTEKYFHTSDLAYYDEDGHFWFVGRKDDVINSSGYRIGPKEVEDALADHPAVVEAAVVGSPDKDRGEVVKAFVILTDSAEPSEELVKELQEHCKRITAPYKYPRKIEFVEELPRNQAGKIKRSELRMRERNKTAPI